MQNGIIKGTGNSRYLKSISNFLTQYPTYQDFVAALVAGTLPIDLNGINETGWDQLGTALNKANLLSDDTVLLYGDSVKTKAMPDTVFNLLSKSVLHNGSVFYNVNDEQINIAEYVHVVGSYSGRGASTSSTPVYQLIDLGFQPIAVLVIPVNYVWTLENGYYAGFTIQGRSTYGLSIHAQGFQVYTQRLSNMAIDLNTSGKTYMYIAFK